MGNVGGRRVGVSGDRRHNTPLAETSGLELAFTRRDCTKRSFPMICAGQMSVSRCMGRCVYLSKFVCVVLSLGRMSINQISCDFLTRTGLIRIVDSHVPLCVDLSRVVNAKLNIRSTRARKSERTRNEKGKGMWKTGEQASAGRDLCTRTGRSRVQRSTHARVVALGSCIVISARCMAVGGGWHGGW